MSSPVQSQAIFLAASSPLFAYSPLLSRNLPNDASWAISPSSNSSVVDQRIVAAIATAQSGQIGAEYQTTSLGNNGSSVMLANISGQSGLHIESPALRLSHAVAIFLQPSQSLPSLPSQTDQSLLKACYRSTLMQRWHYLVPGLGSISVKRVAISLPRPHLDPILYDWRSCVGSRAIQSKTSSSEALS